MVNRLKQEFVYGYSLFDRIFMASMLLLQIIVFIAVPSGWIAVVCGISGVLSVVLCAKGKISFYFIGLIQIVTYGYIAWHEGFYGVLLANIFYLITTVWGIFTWSQNTNSSADVITRKMSAIQWIFLILITLAVTTIFGYVLGQVGSEQAYANAAINILAVFAQIMMVARYREQWVWWLVVNIISLALWISVQNWSMVAMYIAWTINCIYGWVNWTKLLAKGK